MFARYSEHVRATLRSPKTTWLGIAASASLLFAGCGGDDPAFEREFQWVEDLMLYRGQPLTSRWTTDLRVRIKSRLPRVEQRQAVADALEFIRPLIAPLSATLVDDADESANVTVEFLSWDIEEVGAIGLALTPFDEAGEIIRSEISVHKSLSNIELPFVTFHEFYHALGFGHSPQLPDSIMFFRNNGPKRPSALDERLVRFGYSLPPGLAQGSLRVEFEDRWRGLAEFDTSARALRTASSPHPHASESTSSHRCYADAWLER